MKRKHISVHCTAKENVKSKAPVKKTKFPFEKISVGIAILSLLISIISFVFTVRPQINPFNDNPIEKANAGDLDSQLFLANLNYEIGNAGESIKWYTIALHHSGEHKAKVLNNLAVVYLTNSQFYITRQENEIDAMNMFREAIELGEIKAAKNLYLLLTTSPKELFGEKYVDALRLAENTLEKAEIVLGALDKYQAVWEFYGTKDEAFVPEDDGVYRIGHATTEYVFPYEGAKAPVAKHTYNVYRKVDGVDYPDYFYCKITE